MNVLAQDIHATFVINCLSSRLSYEAVSRPYLGILNVIMMLVGFRVKIPLVRSFPKKLCSEEG